MRLRILVARPIARGRNRLIVGPSSAWTALTYRSSPTSSWLCSAFATADSSSLLQSRATARGVMSEDSSRLLDRLSADVVADEPRLARGRAHVLGLRADDRRRQVGIALGTAPPRVGAGAVSAGSSVASAPRRRRRRAGFAGASASGSSSASGSRRSPPRPRRQPRGRPPSPPRLLRPPASARSRRPPAQPGSRPRPKPVAGVRPSVPPRTPSAGLRRWTRPRPAPRRLATRRRFGFGFSSGSSVIASYRCWHDRGRAAWARTRRACGRPSTRR